MSSLILSLFFNVLDWILSLFMGKNYANFKQTLANFTTLVDRIVKTNSMLEKELSSALLRISSTEQLLKNLSETVARLESKTTEQEQVIHDLKLKCGLAMLVPQPLPRTTIPPPPPPPPPMIMTAPAASFLPYKKTKRDIENMETPDNSSASKPHRPSSSELRKRKGLLRPINDRRSSTNSTPLSCLNNRRVLSSTPEEENDIPRMINRALKNKFKSFRPPSPIAGSPPDESTFGSSDFSFSFTA